MAGINELMQQIPIGDIAKKLGVNEATAASAVKQALPTLLGGLKANADDPAGEASITEALQQHDPSLVEGGVNLADVDEADGEKIVNHVFGDNKQQVVQTLGGLPKGGGSALQAKLLPILAPIVLSYLAKQFGGGGGKGGLGGVLADVLGGAAGGSKGGAGGAIGEILGGVLGGGGGKGKGKGPDIGDIGSILGGLLGKGRR